MTVEPGWVPPEIDTSKANVARVYDYWLGGDHNFQADRNMARAALALDPNMRRPPPAPGESQPGGQARDASGLKR